MVLLVPNEDLNINFFAKEIARKITGEHDQNAVILCIGAMGSGKSWTMLELARLISIYIAERLGGVPENYFNMKDNLGIMTMDEISAVYAHMDSHHHCVYIIDDAGATFIKYNLNKVYFDAIVAVSQVIITSHKMTEFRQ